MRQSNGWAYKSDITSFFDRISRQDVVNKTIGLLRARSLHSLLLEAVSCEIENKDDINRIAQANGIKRGLGVRRGMPLSPLLSNVILKDFDRSMIHYNKKMVRYADDFIIFASSEDECIQIDQLARKSLQRLGFELPKLGPHESKTTIADPDEDIEFLGLALRPTEDSSYTLVITQQQLDKINRTLNQLTDVNQLISKNIDITTIVQAIENRIGGYQSAYSDAQNVDELRDILMKCRSHILRHIYIKAFGEKSVRALTKNMCRFLCIE